MNQCLSHHGVKGMKWGVRRTQSQLSRASSDAQKPKGRKLSEVGDDELRSRINRLEMEKRYKDLVTTSTVQGDGLKKGRDFVNSNIVKIGSTVITQVGMYYTGKAINDFLGADVVNVKKSK